MSNISKYSFLSGARESKQEREKQRRHRANRLFSYRGKSFLVICQDVSDQLHLFNPQTREARYLMDIKKSPTAAREAAAAIVRIMLAEQALNTVEYSNPPVAPVNPKRAMAESIGADVVDFDA